MKPNPFSGLNHFTVPVGMSVTSFRKLVFERRFRVTKGHGYRDPKLVHHL
jgi:hypothetical protein